MTVLLAGIAALLVVGAAAVPLARRPWAGSAVYGACLAVSVAMAGAALAALLSGAGAGTLVLPVGLPWLGAHLRLDALSAFFLAVIGLGGAMASLYALAYGRHEAAPQRVLPFYPVFLAAMSLVLLADDAFTFLLSWELMSLASWALVMAHHREAGNARAGFVYLVMASGGTLALLLAFGLLAGATGGYAFAAIRDAAPAGGTALLVLALLLAGAGSKAGLVPLHVWLPLAHPAAPSQVSALMSGVMTKVAVYAVIRVAFDLVGHVPWGVAMAVLAVGGVTAVLGVLQATLESDLKRLLAFSTVENLGIVFVGLGLALAFRANGMEAAAALAFTAALFHVFNHALFKSLLFMGAGAVLTATGTRDLEALGGLIHRMKWTAAAMLVGCAAIAALPPLNGFVSEWLLFQAVLQSPELPQWGLRVLVPGVGALLALSAALAAACFVKAYGIAFLGRARSPAAAGAGEIEAPARTAMAILAGLCVVVGLLPGLVIDGIAPVARQVLGAAMPAQAGLPWLTVVPVEAGRSSYNGLLVFLFVAASAGLAALAVHRLASRAVRRGPAWGCGYPDPGPRAQYAAASFAQPIRRVFGATLLAARESVAMPAPGDTAPARFAVTMRDRVWDALYRPLAAGVGGAADRLNPIQFLTIRRYLGLVFGALVALLLVLALWP